jgi:hypothetical protein
MSLETRVIALAQAIGLDVKALYTAIAGLGGGSASPAFVYDAGALASITYADGTTKVFTYTAGTLAQLDTTRAGVITRKTFNYTDGVLTSITQAVI